jgi:predicted carbohydrate-binding protein with CBM5 and CBM33 domain
VSIVTASANGRVDICGASHLNKPKEDSSMRMLLSILAVTFSSFALAGAAQAEGQGCLDAVASGDYQQAVALCSDALAADPANAELQKALETAQAATEATGGVASPPPAAPDASTD